MKKACNGFPFGFQLYAFNYIFIQLIILAS
jgi:hypothetical protein